MVGKDFPRSSLMKRLCGSKEHPQLHNAHFKVMGNAGNLEASGVAKVVEAFLSVDQLVLKKPYNFASLSCGICRIRRGKPVNFKAFNGTMRPSLVKHLPVLFFMRSKFP
jgi:hypothetical protein